MVQFQEYGMAWLVYFLSVIGLLIVTWRLFRSIPWPYFRGIILCTVAALLLTPVLSEQNYWAPAWLVTILELLFGGIEDLTGIMPVIKIVLVIWLVLLLVYTLTKLMFFRGIGSSRVPTNTKKHIPSGSSLHKTSPRKRVTPTIS
jgi:hypothetical protein